MSNVGHGHVYPREDGSKARCGGPAICGACARDLLQRDRGPLAPTALTRAEQHAEALQWLRDSHSAPLLGYVIRRLARHVPAECGKHCDDCFHVWPCPRGAREILLAIAEVQSVLDANKAAGA